MTTSQAAFSHYIDVKNGSRATPCEEQMNTGGKEDAEE
jgi:hypothetical protein